MEGVQQHLDDAFANKGHPDASPHFPPAAAAVFANSSLAPPQSDAQASTQQTASEQGAAQPQQVSAQVSEDAVSVSSATPQMQDAAAPEAAAAPAAEHTAAELPEGPAQDAAAATAANGIPTAIVPTDNDVVVEAVTVPAAVPKDANAAEAPNGESDLIRDEEPNELLSRDRCFPALSFYFANDDHMSLVYIHLSNSLNSKSGEMSLFREKASVQLQGSQRQSQMVCHQHYPLRSSPTKHPSFQPQPSSRWRLPYRRMRSWCSGLSASSLCEPLKQQLGLI